MSADGVFDIAIIYFIRFLLFEERAETLVVLIIIVDLLLHGLVESCGEEDLEVVLLVSEYRSIFDVVVRSLQRFGGIEISDDEVLRGEAIDFIRSSRAVQWKTKSTITRSNGSWTGMLWAKQRIRSCRGARVIRSELLHRMGRCPHTHSRTALGLPAIFMPAQPISSTRFGGSGISLNGQSESVRTM